MKQTLDEMESMYSTNILPRRTIQRWHKQFCNGRTSAESNPRSGQPRTCAIEVNKNTVAALLAEDPHISQRQLAELMDTSKTSINRILGALGMQRVSCTWVLYMLTGEQMQEQVRMCEECPRMLGEDGNLLTCIVTGMGQPLQPYPQTRNISIETAAQTLPKKKFNNNVCPWRWCWLRSFIPRAHFIKRNHYRTPPSIAPRTATWSRHCGTI